MTGEPTFQGWGFGDTTLSVAPSPEGHGGIAVLYADRKNTYVLADVRGPIEAQTIIDFLNASFRLTSDANRRLAEGVRSDGEG